MERPSRPIVVVTGFPAGAGTDIYARPLAEPLGKAPGTNIVVEDCERATEARQPWPAALSDVPVAAGATLSEPVRS